MAERTDQGERDARPGSDPANGATPGRAQTGNGATPDTGGIEGATPDTPLGDAGREALDAERTARRDADRQLAEDRRRIAEIEDAGKPELERAQAASSAHRTRSNATRAQRVAELEAQIAERDLRDLKRKAAAEVGPAGRAWPTGCRATDLASAAIGRQRAGRIDRSRQTRRRYRDRSRRRRRRRPRGVAT